MTASHSLNTFAVRGDLEVVMTRVFDAPRELVFRAHVDRELIPRWWGPRGSVVRVEKLDARPGGEWLFVDIQPDGTEIAFNGVHREVVAPELISRTFNYQPMPGHESLETLTLEDVDGKTLLTSTMVFRSVEDREGMVNSGMEGGATESMERLAELLQQQ